MFTIILKNNRAEIEIITTKALLAIAGVAVFLYGDARYPTTRIVVSVLLVMSSFFVRKIVGSFKQDRLVLLSIATMLTYFTTHSLLFAMILLIHSIFFQFLNKKTKVEIGQTAITIHYVFSKKIIEWTTLNNVILKDRMLTIDFKNDHLLQSEIAEESFGIDEKVFNTFCNERLDK